MKISDQQLKSIISKLCAIEVDLIKNETMLIGDLKMDSIKIIELLAILSEEYQIHANESDAANFHTYLDLYNFTQAYQE